MAKLVIDELGLDLAPVFVFAALTAMPGLALLIWVFSGCPRLW